MRRGLAYAALASGALFVTLAARAQQTPACIACAAYEPPAVIGRVEDPAITELSGLAASRAHPGLYYAHNDSGDRPRFFAIDEHGARRGEFAVTNASAVDWEDIAVGPCGSGSCVFIGDTGDNHASRTTVAIYRIEEPALPSQVATTVRVLADRIEFSYPDRPQDAEALAIDPSNGTAYVFTKAYAHTRVYRLVPPWRARMTASFVTELAVSGRLFPFVTAADIHPCASRVLLRTYTGAFEYRAPGGGSIEDALGTSPIAVPYAHEFQSEAIAYRADGAGYLTAPEGAHVELNGVRCRAP